MLSALQALTAEQRHLEGLSGTIASNATALNTSLAAADDLIKKVPGMPEPKVDDLLVAPTAVANQLYDAVCEERAMGDAVFVVGRAVERGRVAPATAVKVIRGLGREWFLKKVLVRKCSRGLGLDEGWKVRERP
jgi:ESCRT-I complex subunit TSG101